LGEFHALILPEQGGVVNAGGAGSGKAEGRMREEKGKRE
jgi:hypothetical protein